MQARNRSLGISPSRPAKVSKAPSYIQDRDPLGNPLTQQERPRSVNSRSSWTPESSGIHGTRRRSNDLGSASKLKSNFFQRMRTGEYPSNKSSLPNQTVSLKFPRGRDSMMTNARSKSSAIGGQSPSNVYSRQPRRAS